MDELITCSMKCRNKPAYVCDCSDKTVFLCINHAGPHAVSKGNHHYTEIMKIPEPQTKIIISKFLKDLKQRAKHDSLRIIQDSSLLIKNINNVTIKSLGKLSHIEKKLDEYIYLCTTLEEVNNLNSKSFIESLLKLSAEDASKIKCEDDIIKINKDNFREKIENLFTVQETKKLFDIGKFEVLKPKEQIINIPEQKFPQNAYQPQSVWSLMNPPPPQKPQKQSKWLAPETPQEVFPQKPYQPQC